MKRIFILTIAFVSGSVSSIVAGDLEDLTASYEREKSRVLTPIEEKYDRALKALQTKLTKAGRIEEAVAVKKVLEARNKDAKSDWLHAEGDWLRASDTNWKWQSGGELILQKNRRARHSRWQRPGKWKRTDEETVELIDGADRKFILKFKDRKSAAVISSSGGTTLITLIEEE